MIVNTTTQVFFSPQDDTIAEFENLLNAATKSIYLADYSFNIPEVATLLGNKFKAGLDVKLVLDKSQSAGSSEIPEIKLLQTAGVPTVIVESSDHQIMHNKFTIIDNETCQAGSWNYTSTAADENNFFFVFTDSQIAEIFTNDFNSMFTGQTTEIKSTIGEKE